MQLASFDSTLLQVHIFMSTTNSTAIIWAIIGLVAFFPTGLVALYFALKGQPAKARVWGIISAVVLLIGIILQFVLGIAIIGAIFGG